MEIDPFSEFVRLWRTRHGCAQSRFQCDEPRRRVASAVQKPPLLLNGVRPQPAFVQPRLTEANVIKLLRLEKMREATGLSRATIYTRINNGLLAQPIRHGERLSVWPSNEVEAITKATIAGKIADEIRVLVASLEAQRANAA